MSYGPHQKLDLFNGDFDSLSDLDNCRRLLDELPGLIGMTKITEPNVFWYNPPDNIIASGITGMVIIAESHISIHTYPYKNYAFIDVFSCKPFDTHRAKSFVQELFRPERITEKVTPRGEDFPIDY